ncbi:MAG: hypothetical protein ACOX7N_00255 [Lawsonibacter sp.]
MKRYLLGAMALSLTFLCACGLIGKAPASSGAGTRPPVAGDLLPAQEDNSASSVQQPPAPDLEVSTRWRSEYRYDAQVLGQTLSKLAQLDDTTMLGRWPDGREYVGTDSFSLLFSSPADKSGSVCAAMGLDLHEETTVEQLKEEWGDSLVFTPNDLLAGPCWMVTDGEMTYRFCTDSTGNTLVAAGGNGNLVLSQDDLLPERPSADWRIPARTWGSYWVEQPGSQWDDLLTYAQALSSGNTPSEATAPADPAYLDLFFALRGVKDPDTGVQYFSSGVEGDPWDGILVPANLLLGNSLPTNPDQVMQILDTPFYWSAFNLPGYWFYLDQYAVCLTSDLQGTVGTDSYFFIRWGDNADMG